MAPKGGTFFLLLTVACAVLVNLSDGMPSDIPDLKNMAKKLMRKCQNQGYPKPQMEELGSVFSNGVLPTGRNGGQSNALLSNFVGVLNSVAPVEDALSRIPLDDSAKLENKMWNCSRLATMIKQMNSSDGSSCYLRAFVAPLSWMTLTTQTENNIDPEDYDTLLQAVKPVVQNMPSSRMSLPKYMKGQGLKGMMKMLQEMYNPMSEEQKNQVAKWAKEQIVQNDFNCTMTQSSDSRLKLMDRCKPSLKWLNSEALDTMGPYLSRLTPADVDSSPTEKLCEFCRSGKLKSALSMETKMKPTLGKKFFQKIEQCFSGEEFAQNVDKLGPLACFITTPPDLTSDLSAELLDELEECDDNPKIKQLKRGLVKTVMSNSNAGQALRKLGKSISLLSSEDLSELSDSDLKESLKILGSTVKWTPRQMRALIKKQLGDKKCKEVTRDDLKTFQSVAEGLPRCVLKQMKAPEILNDVETLKNISKKMKKGQLKAVLQGLHKGADISDLVQRLPGSLLRSLSVNTLSKANINLLDQVVDKDWNLPQAAYLALKMRRQKQLIYRKLRSICQGVTCQMIDEETDVDVKDMAQAITASPQWVSKVLAGCLAQKLFTKLETERADYFKTITEEELDQIPTVLLLYLPPLKIQELPDSVCPVFLDKMEMANLSALPRRAPSRPALTKRALLCLANGADMNAVTADDVSRLGPLLCELSASQLRLMAPDVQNSSLLAMSSCQHIPEDHRADLIQMVTQTFGDQDDWSAETMEVLGPFILLDDGKISALPKKPWMKDVLSFLKSRVSCTSEALKKKLFDLTTTTFSEARKKRAANENSNGNSGNTGSTTTTTVSSSDISNITTPTTQVIEDLGQGNVYWTAAQLEQMSDETFLATVEILGNVFGYSADQLAVLTQKAIKAWAQLTEAEVTQMGCISQGFSDADLEKLPFSMDAVEQIAQCGWNESQLEPMWKGISTYNNLTAQKLGTVEMVTLNRFICGLNSNEIKQLNQEAFKDAMGSFDGIQCSLNVTQELKNLAVSALGDPSTWTEAQVTSLGSIIAGLDADELKTLNTSVFPFLSKSCIKLIPPTNFAALSVAQIAALGPDNAAMVTKQQQAALSEDQLAALRTALSGSREQDQNAHSRAPSLNVEGFAAFVTPLLLLLVGLLLL